MTLHEAKKLQSAQRILAWIETEICDRIDLVQDDKMSGDTAFLFGNITAYIQAHRDVFGSLEK